MEPVRLGGLFLMRTVNNMLQAVFNFDLEKITIETMVITEDEFIMLQKENLQYGLKGSGEKIGLYRNEDYANLKHSMNARAGFGNVDLKLTGDFYAGIGTHISKEGFLIESSDEKAAMLEKKYGDPFGLDDDRKKLYADIAGPAFVNQVAKSI